MIDDSELKAVEDAEGRLEARSLERRRLIARRDRRRRWLPWMLCPIVLPLVGAAVLVAVVESAGGDLSGRPLAQAVAAMGACVLVPAALSVWVGRWHGRFEAVIWGLVAVFVEVALVFGVAFAGLGYGP